MPLEYPDIVRFARYALIVAALLSGAALPPSVAQQPAPAPAPAAAPMFSGVITAVSATNLTVLRTEPKDTKTFLVTPETKFEGPKPQVNARVTVRYITAEDGDRAVRVIVRAPAKATKK